MLLMLPSGTWCQPAQTLSLDADGPKRTERVRCIHRHGPLRLAKRLHQTLTFCIIPRNQFVADAPAPVRRLGKPNGVAGSRERPGLETKKSWGRHAAVLEHGQQPAQQGLGRTA